MVYSRTGSGSSLGVGRGVGSLLCENHVGLMYGKLSLQVTEEEFPVFVIQNSPSLCFIPSLKISKVLFSLVCICYILVVKENKNAILGIRRFGVYSALSISSRVT